MANAPQAIFDLYNTIANRIPAAQLGGIVGDRAHSFGYHLSRNELPNSDYSVQMVRDREGNPDNASALDVTFGAGSQWMITCTNRLLAAARAGDPRLHSLREFCGTTDGMHTHPYDLSNGQDGPLDSWDSSHLFHIHLSFYRADSENYAALAPIADVFTGVGTAAASPSSPSLEDDMFLLFNYQNTVWVTPISLQYKRTFSSPASLQAWQRAAQSLGAKYAGWACDPVQAASIPTGASIA